MKTEIYKHIEVLVNRYPVLKVEFSALPFPYS